MFKTGNQYPNSKALIISPYLKQKLPLSLIKHHTMYTYESRGTAPCTLKMNNTIGGGQLHASTDLPKGKEPPYPLTRRVDEPQRWHGF
jgi:hypothetical protein